MSAPDTPLPEQWRSLPKESLDRLRRLCAVSPLYSGELARFPEWGLWLEAEENISAPFRYGALIKEWSRFASSAAIKLEDEAAHLAALRRWRRLMSIRVAHRSVNGLAEENVTTAELTRLAEFCIRDCLALALAKWTDRLGQPSGDTAGSRARFCVMALGKMGGEELNFSSDIDLVYVYEGDGYCERGGVETSTSSAEFFTKVAESLTRFLTDTTEDGFLFRVDARLRPEGAAGPLVRSLSSMENYYALAGQTWERLAWLKARTIAGDLGLGAELLESLQSFRYPRHPPPSLLAEVAAMKARTEREILGANTAKQNVKLGRGGIREIEFIVQVFQLLNAGRYPFLQTFSTEQALEQLARYELIDRADARFLRSAYWKLRTIEHRIQMRDEEQTHDLPSSGPALEAIARSLGFASARAFADDLAPVRQRIRNIYESLFEGSEIPSESEDWWTFFTQARSVPPVVEKKLHEWFGGEVDAADLRLFACGDTARMVTKEQVTRFQHLAASFGTWTKELARPSEALRRLSRFAERYASRSHFFSSCTSNPQFLRVLALLFDRSTFVHELLCARPEIFEEVLRPENLLQRKSFAATQEELRRGPVDLAEFSRWLTLYVRAEQVRYTIAELLDFSDQVATETALSKLADCVMDEVFRRFGLSDAVLVVALGKYGGEELTLGSDLDMVFVGTGKDRAVIEARLRGALACLRGDDPLGPTLAIDARLRPYGEAGPLLTSIEALQRYHAGEAQLWERQSLTRARVVTGAAGLAGHWASLIAEYVFGPGLEAQDLAQIWRMRERIEHERDRVLPPERAFKTGPGGLIDQEFFAQALQLRFGASDMRLHEPNTRRALAALAQHGRISERAGEVLRKNYEFLKRVELLLRRDENRSISVLPEDPTLPARWLGYASAEAFWREHVSRMQATRQVVREELFFRENGTN
ncbi:MAG TPA: hypothetical protein VFT72_10895 [Opitutaceae bacterium]|nr:hypothetical protein [Opitutaceae bacterium]